MFKFFVFFAVCAVAFGEIFTPKLQPCAFHAYVDEYDDYIMLSAPYEGYMYMKNTTNGFVEIIRCDIKNVDGYCLYITRDPKGMLCFEEWTDPSEGDWYNMEYLYRCMDSPFEYTAGPESCDCPVYNQNLRANLTPSNCRKYTNGDKFIIVDEDDRLIQNVEGWIMTYTDDEVPTSIFELDDCWGEIHYGAPENVCQVKTHKIAKTPCAFHSYCDEYEDWNMLPDSATGALRMTNPSAGTDEIIRCDIKNDKGFCLYITLNNSGTTPEEKCKEEWTDPALGEWYDMNYIFHSWDTPFKYTKGPIAVQCPVYNPALRGNTTPKGCKMFWNEENDETIIVDLENMLIRNEYGSVMTWTDDAVTLDKFHVTYCNGSAIPDYPEYQCTESTLTPKKADCSFHVLVDEYDDYVMLKSPTEGYMYMKNTSNGAVEIIRCDVKNERGHCLYITRFSNDPKDCVEEWTDPKIGDWYNMEYLYHCMDAPFKYTLGPFDVDCPVYNPTLRGKIVSQGCKKYTNGDDYVIIDDQNRVVRNVEGWVLTYTDDPVPVSQFDLAYCNGTKLPTPTDVCKVAPKPVPSSASTVVSSALFVVLALLVALF